MTRKPAKKSPAKKTAASAPPMEAAMRQLEKLMASGDLITQDDLNALLASLNGPSAQEGLRNAEADARDEAQQLAFDAMEAETETQARKLARRALAKDPDCVDALVVLAEIEANSPRQMIEMMQKAVAAGERSLGARFIQENKGYFWGLMETRPYMRAMAQLADLLRGVGMNLDAISHYEKVLELNPNDNQGVRDPLLGLYLATNNLERASKLLKDYKEDSSASFAWTRVLERFLTGDQVGAGAALKIARKANHFVELYLSGKKETPKAPPEMYSPGSEDEAVLVLVNLSLALAEHKEAAFWLLDQLTARGTLQIVPARARKRVQ